MHIGFIEDTPFHGGTQIWVTEAISDFIGKKHEVSVLAPTDTWVAKESALRGARVVTYDWDGVCSKGDEYKKIWIEGLARCDVAVTTVHPPRNSFHCSVFGGLCIREGNLDTILIPKSGTIVPEYKREFYYPEPEIKSKVISITNFTRTYLIKKYKLPKEMIELIYQGTELDRFVSTEESKKEALKRYPLPENAAPILASVGSFEERKGQIILLQAVEKLSKGSMPNVHAMFVGDGPDEEMLKVKVKELGIANNVSFFPFTSEPNYVFDRVDILTLPSLYKEGLPNVILEAMAMKLPSIASEMAGVPEVVINEKTGYLVEPGNIDQFAGAVEKLWADPNKCRLIGINGRKFVEEKMDKKKQFDEFLRYFERITCFVSA